ncbi:unnamed protein product [Rotaria sp. Silwood1]|nr:unnamed protein product [Rotaria sp. Silwood1]CAF1604623.1 unnamed protein product [Rotaria sp. Silwood1]CAF3710167.1 unnamed protein product [Rotaria sp. Silwood1]CAF4678831.1 unnamed protein product [Rotaria sp. Silwood1]
MPNEILNKLCSGLPLNPLPSPKKTRNTNVPHAPDRKPSLTDKERKLAIKNALRYFPSNIQPKLIDEFMYELDTYGHIYMYRFQPDIEIHAYPIDEYPCKCKAAAGIMLMIMNNLDRSVAQFPDELVTYGGNGQVFSNWAQFLLVMHYLSTMTDEQVLIMYSGHPMGLFPTRVDCSPRVVITNGLNEYDQMFALGCTMYGQMTAGSYCYIGPQGIVHGTFITIMNAARKKFGKDDLRGKVFVSSGLGGMSGAQPKACQLLGCIGVIAEVSEEAAKKRYDQGWCEELIYNLNQLMTRIRECREKKLAISIGYVGNVVDVWERLANEKETLVDLGSDQTSCHNPYQGGYYPVQLSYDEARQCMKNDPKKFKELVHESIKRQIAAIDKLYERGMYFFDYGNAFLLTAKQAGAPVGGEDGERSIRFKYPSYVQDIMGDIFSLGFGPFRWVCASGLASDLQETDKIAEDVIKKLMSNKDTPDNVLEQYNNNLKWIQEAENAKLVVGSQARILYSDQMGRINIGLAFNQAVQTGRLKGPIILSRDHHDVSGTDSPYRETANIEDGSAFCADMSIQNVIGDSFRGATWVALHNGGGVGWGEVMNGGFGMFLDGSTKADDNIRHMLYWDVINGVSRRSWSGNKNARETVERAMTNESKLKVTMPNELAEECMKKLSL